MGDKQQVAVIGGTTVMSDDGALYYSAKLDIDADGSPCAYHPPTQSSPKSGKPPGLDTYQNGRNPNDGTWFGALTKDAAKKVPIVQGPNDPAPGFYISTTSLRDAQSSTSDARRYVDSEKVPFIVIPGSLVRPKTPKSDIDRLKPRMGDLAIVWWRSSYTYAIAADVGPRSSIGEGSIALALALGIIPKGTPRDKYMKYGHDSRDVVHLVFAGSAKSPAWPRQPAEMRQTAADLFARWGGQMGGPARLAALFPNYVHLSAGASSGLTAVQAVGAANA